MLAPIQIEVAHWNGITPLRPLKTKTLELLDDRFDLDRKVARQRTHPDSRSGMSAAVSQDINKNIRSAIDLRVPGEGQSRDKVLR